MTLHHKQTRIIFRRDFQRGSFDQPSAVRSKQVLCPQFIRKLLSSCSVDHQSSVEMSASYGVISWKMQGGDPLDPEELEVCKLNALIIKNASIPRPGVTVMLQFKQTLWEGSILSVHGKKKDAEAALIAAETPRSAPVEVVASTSKPTDPVMHESTSSTKRGQLGRPRKKKSFGDDFVHEQNQGLSGEGEKDSTAAAAGNKQVSLSRKKDTTNVAANNEKKRGKEKRKEERQKQRSVLAEQNSLLLSRMVAVEEEDEHNIDNTCNLIQDCMEILQVPQNALQTSQLTPQANSINSTQRPDQPFQPPMPTSTNVTPLQNLPQPPWSPTSIITPIQTPPQTSLSSSITPQRARPQFGGKCPRRRQLGEQDEDSECSSCKRLKAEILNLRKQLASYEAQNDQAPPKPGKVIMAIANQYKMIELSPGSGVYVFDKHIEQAVARKSATSCAAFLLNCFYTNQEMAGMNLTGANEKPCPDKDIIDSILAFTMKKHQCTGAVLKASLRNKFSANTSRAKKAERS